MFGESILPVQGQDLISLEPPRFSPNWDHYPLMKQAAGWFR